MLCIDELNQCVQQKKKKEITSTRLLMSNPYDCLTVSIIQGLVFQKHCSVTIILSIRMVQIVTAFMTTLFFFFFSSIKPGPQCCHDT